MKLFYPYSFIITGLNDKEAAEIPAALKTELISKYNISEKDIADYLRRWKNDSREDAIRYLRKDYKYDNEHPYVVEFNLSKVDGTGSYCDLRISTSCYDESLPRKSIILYREEEENA